MTEVFLSLVIGIIRMITMKVTAIRTVIWVITTVVVAAINITIIVAILITQP